MTAVPPRYLQSAAAIGGITPRIDATLLAAHAADARAYPLDAVSFTISTIVRAAG